jgi:ribonuclease HI
MYFDGSYTLKGAGASIVLIPPEGDVLKYAIQIEFPATNNIVEYEGLVNGVWLAKDLGIHWLLIRGDSQLVVKQVQKEYNCKNDMMAGYLAEVRRMEKFFVGFEVRYVPYLDNRDADHLSWIASYRALTPLDVIVEWLSNPSVQLEESTRGEVGVDLMVINETPHQPASHDNAKVERIARKSRMYHLIDGVLYQQRANEMMMRCISREEGIQLLEDIHKGVCGSHSSWCSIIGKAFRHGFYWPTAKDDAMEVVKSVKSVSSSRSKQWSMSILFGLSISPGPLQSGELTLWASYQG